MPGSGLAFNYQVILSTTNAPASASNPTQLTAATGQECTEMDFHNSSGGPINVYYGAALAEVLLCTVPGMASVIGSIQRSGISVPKGARLSFRAVANAALNTGYLIINGWV